MSDAPVGRAAPAGFWRVVWLLLGASYRRTRGRIVRQRQLAGWRSGKSRSRWAGIGFVVMVLTMTLANGLAAFVILQSTVAAERMEAQWQGHMPVSRNFMMSVHIHHAIPATSLNNELQAEARLQVQRFGGDVADIRQKLAEAMQSGRQDAVVAIEAAAPGLRGLPGAGNFTHLIGSLVLLMWCLMLALQGEGLEMDVQRRRHPMWEFLFSHPVSAGAVFLAEMLGPMAANPIYYSAALFPGLLYGVLYGPLFGCLAAVVVGIPVTMALACLGKAVEIGALLRLPMRTRGAMIGLMSWLGFVTMMLFFLAASSAGRIVTSLAPALEPLTAMAWPWLGLFLGQFGHGEFSFAAGVLTCWSASLAAIGLSMAIAVWSVQRGLSASGETVEMVSMKGGSSFGKNALRHKELLWLRRDRSALVQAFLVPLSMGAFQLFQLRGVAIHAADAWNYFCGGAILFGTYFLMVLGPKSLASDGSALWIALSWPRGMEALLKAKARLWTWMSSAIVGVILCVAGYEFPESIWKIALVGVGWLLFARSMAEKAVTLATVTAESGEVEKISYGGRLATQLGTLSFAVGVITERWQLAIVGIVYSYVTAAAMWQNFRARLPFLSDPWSEKLPPPPTLMHAMIGISVLVELTAVISVLVLFLGQQWAMGLGQAISYGSSAAIISLAMIHFLRRRDVRLAQIWNWPRADGERMAWPTSLGLALALGLALGGFGLLYLAAIREWPEAAQMMDEARERLAGIPYAHVSLIISAVLIAPPAEEFLFRGLLYRALDRQWGGWTAVLGSAAFFAIYHPALSWLPVALLGAVNALLFRRTGRLAPCVLTHMIYNAIVLV